MMDYFPKSNHFFIAPYRIFLTENSSFLISVEESCRNIYNDVNLY